MFRKTILALAATVAVGAAMLTPTTASAWHHHHHGHGLRAFGLRRRDCRAGCCELATSIVWSRPVAVCAASS